MARSTFPKSKSTKHTSFGALFEVEMSKKCTPLCREAYFRSQKAQSTPASEHFLKLRCRTSARCRVAKHISKSKCAKHTILRALLEVELSKKCMRWWREHISKSKCTKHLSVGPLLEVGSSKKCTRLWRGARFKVI